MLSTVSKWSSHFASVSRLCWRHGDNDSGDDNNTLFYSRARNNDQAACKSLCCVTRKLFSQRRGSGWGSRQFHLSSPKPQPMPRGYGLDQRVSGFATTRLLGRSLLFASLPLSPCTIEGTTIFLQILRGCLRETTCTSNCKPSSLAYTTKDVEEKDCSQIPSYLCLWSGYFFQRKGRIEAHVLLSSG